MRLVDIVLKRSFHFGTVEWKHRDISTTGEYSKDPDTSSYRELHDEVLVKGMLSIGHKITAHVIFAGCTFFTESAFDPHDDVDHSQPLQIEKICFTLTTNTGKEVKKTCFFETSMHREIEDREMDWLIR